MEDSSTFGPVSVETASIKESVSFFEKEIISDELVLLSLGHGGERVESSSQLAFEGVASLDNLCLNCVSLLFGDSRAKREFSQVSSNSDSS